MIIMFVIIIYVYYYFMFIMIISYESSDILMGILEKLDLTLFITWTIR